MAEARTAARSRLADFDPLKALWRVLTSVRFALALIGFLALAAFLGVVLPQLPAAMRDNPAAVAAWLSFQEGKFGFLTHPMYDLGLFQVFRSPWFVSALGLLVLSVCVCTANRLGPVWRNVTRPQTRVPDEYFERSAQAIALATVDSERLATELRRRRYRVVLQPGTEAVFVFADRFPWAQLATFVSHLALILFLAGGLVTLITAKQQQVFVAEGEAGVAVFALDDPDHMQIHVEDAVGRFDSAGRAVDYRTTLSVYRDGREIASGVATVNRPLQAGSFRVHQAAYFPDGAALRVRDAATGRTLYDEVLALTSAAETPRVVFRDSAGTILLDDAIVPTDFLGEVQGARVAGTQVAVPGSGREFWLGAAPRDGAWQLIAFETGTGPEAARAVLDEGESFDLGGLSLTFAGVTPLPSTPVGDNLPGIAGGGVAELSSEPQGDLLTLGPIEGHALTLAAGIPVVHGGYEYTFLGRREFAGLTVRRDRGSSIIWLATGALLAGLALTFYTPRRRLWGKITAEAAWFRGLGGRASAIESEIKEVAATAAASGGRG